MSRVIQGDYRDRGRSCREPATIGEAVHEAAEHLQATQQDFRPIDITLPVPQRWNEIRRLYRAERDHIDAGIYTAYLANWDAIFTPIERAMWEAIRCYGGLRFFPQYPVGRYFVDFGDPWSCIAIECDGKQWHDEQTDAIRDSHLEQMGWRVFRIPGNACFLRQENGRDLAFEMLENIYQRNCGRHPNHSEEGEEAFG
jgi:very-short-patch-repair endonuclease